jgi:hypothetical protein
MTPRRGMTSPPAIRSVSATKGASGCGPMVQPTTFLMYESSSTATYHQPSWVHRFESCCICLALLALISPWRCPILTRTARDSSGSGKTYGVEATTRVYRWVGQCAAVLMQLALSRSREVLADACGACLTYHPLALARALRKCAAWCSAVPRTVGSPATAYLCIVKPFPDGRLVRWFSTHLSTETRIACREAWWLMTDGCCGYTSPQVPDEQVCLDHLLGR